MSTAWEPDAGLVTGDGVVLELSVARLPSRILSYAIDLAVMVAGYSALGLLAAFLSAVTNASDSADAAVGVVMLVGCFLGYPVAMDTLNRGRTLGKLALGLRTVRDDGGAIGFGQALVRGLAGILDFGTLGVGALVSAILSGRDKRIGDRLAGTFVIRERAPRGPRPARDRPPRPSAELSRWADRSDLVGLDDQLAARITAYLARRGQLTPEADDRIAGQLAAVVATRVSPPPPGVPAADYLAAVVASRPR